MASVVALDRRVAGVVRQVAERFWENKCPQRGGRKDEPGGRVGSWLRGRKRTPGCEGTT